MSFFALSSDGQQIVTKLVKAIKEGNKEQFDSSMQSLPQCTTITFAHDKYITNLLGYACLNKSQHTSYFIKKIIDAGVSPHKAPDVYSVIENSINFLFASCKFKRECKVVSGLLPLDISIHVGNVVAVKTLLSYNVDPEKSSLNYNPSMIAKWLGESALEHAKLYKHRKQGGQCVCPASEQQLDTIIELLEEKMKENEEFDADLKASGMQMCIVQ